MLGLFEKLKDSPRERVAFAVALALTMAVGGVWFRLSFPSSEPNAMQATAPRHGGAPPASAEDADGPFANFRAELADAAMFLAGQVRKIGEVWKQFDFGKPVEFEREK